MAAAAPSLLEIVKRNWTLDEFISSGYLDDEEINPEILEGWALEISPKVAQLYRRLGWNAFKDDLLLIFRNPGHLIISGNKSGVWFRQEKEYLLFLANQQFEVSDITSFEDVFLNLVSLNGEEIKVVSPEPLGEDIILAYDAIYSQHQDEAERLISELNAGRAIRITGFPIELAISPIAEMVDGYMFSNSDYEIIVIGEILTPDGLLAAADVYSWTDGYRLLVVLSLNQDKWQLVDL